METLEQAQAFANDTDAVNGASRKTLQAAAKLFQISGNLSNIILRESILKQHSQKDDIGIEPAGIYEDAVEETDGMEMDQEQGQQPIYQNINQPSCSAVSPSHDSTESISIDSSTDEARFEPPTNTLPLNLPFSFPGTTAIGQLRDSIGSSINSFVPAAETTITSMKQFVFGGSPASVEFEFTAGKMIDKVTTSGEQYRELSAIEELELRVKEGNALRASGGLPLPKFSYGHDRTFTPSNLKRSQSTTLFDAAHEKEFEKMQSISAGPLKRSISQVQPFSFSTSKKELEMEPINDRPIKKSRIISTQAIPSPSKRKVELAKAKRLASPRKLTKRSAATRKASLLPPSNPVAAPVKSQVPVASTSVVASKTGLFNWSGPKQRNFDLKNSTSTFGEGTNLRISNSLAAIKKRPVYDPKASISSALGKSSSYKPKTGPLPPTFEPSASSTLESTSFKIKRPVVSSRALSGRVQNGSLLHAVKAGDIVKNPLESGVPVVKPRIPATKLTKSRAASGGLKDVGPKGKAERMKF